MTTAELIKEIERLPFSKRILVIEKAIHSIRKSNDDKIQMSRSAELLIDDYKNDNDLIAFSNLDFEDFYEAR
jgi:hypothetical protein